MSLIQRMTKDCPREDCAIVFDASRTTLMGWSLTYDKHGNQTGRDPNITTSSAKCMACGKAWATREQYDEWTISVTASPMKPR